MLSLLAAARRLRAARIRRAENSSASFTVGDRQLDEPQLLGESRVGHLSWRARLDGAPVKICECRDDRHARFLDQVSRIPPLNVFLPSPILREGPFLVVQWVEGTPLRWQAVARNADLLVRVTRLQRQLHAGAGATVPPGGFDYIAFLEARWRRYQSILPLAPALERILETLAAAAPAPPGGLSHPDVSAANVIVERATGNLKLIDNELMGPGNHFLIDLLSTHRSFGSRWRDRLARPYLEAYRSAGGDLSELVRCGRFLTALWALARVGALLQHGAIARAEALATPYLEDRPQVHELIALAARVTT